VCGHDHSVLPLPLSFHFLKPLDPPKVYQFEEVTFRHFPTISQILHGSKSAKFFFDFRHQSPLTRRVLKQSSRSEIWNEADDCTSF